jgi:hypothetical protein
VTCVAVLALGCAGGATPSSGDGEDGAPDAGAGAGCRGPEPEACYGGPAGTDGVGICGAGIRRCEDGAWTACLGEVLPGAEVCNGTDDDCDGAVDEDMPGCGDEDADAGPIDPGPPGDFEFAHDCWRPMTQFEAEEITETELHVIGVYAASEDEGTAEATVEVDRPADVVLVLSSYRAVNWTVTAVPFANVERVILNGYQAQTAAVPDGVEVENHSGLGAYIVPGAYEWPGAGLFDTQALVAAVEDSTDLALATFHGCYHGSRFTLGEE